MKVEASRFKDVEFMTAAQKAKVLRAWTRFLKGGLKRDHFTKALYDHLVQHASFIAHFSQAGFYATYFTEGENTVRFLAQFTTGVSTEYGGTWWINGDYADINQALCDEAKKYAPGLVEAARAKQRDEDMARAKALMAKHGVVA